MQGTLHPKRCFCQHGKAVTFPTALVPHHRGRNGQPSANKAAVSTHHSPAGQHPPPLAASAPKTRDSTHPQPSLHVLLPQQQCSTVVWGKIHCGLFVLGRPCLRRATIKGLLARYANIFLLCWMWVGMRNVAEHGYERK